MTLTYDAIEVGNRTSGRFLITVVYERFVTARLVQPMLVSGYHGNWSSNGKVI